MNQKPYVESNKIHTTYGIVRRVLRRARTNEKTVDQYLTMLLDNESTGYSTINKPHFKERCPELIARNDQHFPKEELRLPNHILRSMQLLCDKHDSTVKELLERYVAIL